MLAAAELVGFLATRDPDRSRSFFVDTLGLELVADDPFALVFDSNGTQVRVVKVAEFTPLPFTVMGWETGEFDETVSGLAARGVAFERFPQLEQESMGVWNTPGGTRIAGFKDPDGNLLSIVRASLHPQKSLVASAVVQ